MFCCLPGDRERGWWVSAAEHIWCKKSKKLCILCAQAVNRHDSNCIFFVDCLSFRFGTSRKYRYVTAIPVWVGSDWLLVHLQGTHNAELEMRSLTSAEANKVDLKRRALWADEGEPRKEDLGRRINLADGVPHEVWRLTRESMESLYRLQVYKQLFKQLF